jgi:hypothetical protein
MSEPSIDELQAKYGRLCHAMQSGVAMEMNVPERMRATEPKHLRTGINTSMSDHGALVKLLVDKGVITEREYFTSLCVLMAREVEAYELRLSEHFGKRITLA